ncbi:hypothetical protein CAOG_000510 [Capsaspora owczarzaki ATCC 30864]|uniref:Small EDRK-rich factor-like N-terminal domain-containing protein n=1 Tax=Capsaspora owczarzaki (strain ATCC 30864) TaxID=595528 RepID=A0A0D2VGE3_CAPO3|nr:hypothetical protein CAOG_000510 [Capsaspora owczarzaki ATCC 30864]
MTRGLQKLQAQAKNNEKKAAAGKKSDGKAAAAAAIKYNCQFCKAPMSDLQTYREHFDAKHPKLAHPPEFATA